jgi:hypothetical protein
MLATMSDKPPVKTDVDVKSKGLATAITKIGIGVVLLLVKVTEPNRGFIWPKNDEAMGWDVACFLIYFFCIWAIISGVRTLYSRPAKVQSEFSGGIDG